MRGIHDIATRLALHEQPRLRITEIAVCQIEPLLWRRSTAGKPKQNAAPSQNGSAGAMPGATRVDAARPTVKPLQPSEAEVSTCLAAN